MSNRTYPNRVNEHLLVPILLVVMTFTLFIGIYCFNEYIKEYQIIGTFYLLNDASLKQYRNDQGLIGIYAAIVLMLQYVVLRINKRWGYIGIIVLTNLLMYLFFSHL
ncbi:hypothetical protein [Aquimarina sp. I32.4]|uniref:hypothetical protein n=1 Tax=Aquimarina sp. I32.4 TaxID=2053903 RepID=UPI000CDE8CC5|nr:hypothetical protein [Aquimarina sp. I32.4]